MLAELDAGAFELAAMQAGGGAFHNAAGDELKVVELLHQGGIEISAGEIHDRKAALSQVDITRVEMFLTNEIAKWEHLSTRRSSR
jgi:hypothetical protein